MKCLDCNKPGRYKVCTDCLQLRIVNDKQRKAEEVKATQEVFNEFEYIPAKRRGHIDYTSIHEWDELSKASRQRINSSKNAVILERDKTTPKTDSLGVLRRTFKI